MSKTRSLRQKIKKQEIRVKNKNYSNNGFYETSVMMLTDRITN